MPWFDLKNATISFVDGTPTTPNKLEAKLGEGNLTYSEKKNRQYLRNRGLLSDVRNGDEEPVEVRMDFVWEFLKSLDDAEVPTIEEVLKQTGPASEWVSTDADPCNPYCLDIIIDYEPPCDSVDGEQITLSDFRYESLDHDGKAGTLAMTGKCNVAEASVERVARS